MADEQPVFTVDGRGVITDKDGNVVTLQEVIDANGIVESHG